MLFKINEEVNKLKSGNRILKNRVSKKLVEHERLKIDQSLLETSLTTTNKYLQEFCHLFSQLMITGLQDDSSKNDVLDRIVSLDTMLEWEIDDGKWLEDFEKDEQDKKNTINA